MTAGKHTFGKEEHIVSKLQIDRLFSKGGSRFVWSIVSMTVRSMTPWPCRCS